MPLQRTSLLLPCRSWDDFPTHLRGVPAAELLAAWAVAWHPALLAATQKLPAWHAADLPPEPDLLQGELILIPGVGRDRLPSDWRQRIEAAPDCGTFLVDCTGNQEQVAAQALAAAGLTAESIDDDLMRDFFALGYAYLQVSLLTRATRYASVFAAEAFEAATVGAAKAALAGDPAGATDGIARALDLLADARNHYYAVDFYIVDVTLLTATILGEPLRARLASRIPTTLLASAALIAQLADDHPETLAELQAAIAAGTACIAGGLADDDADPNQLAPEALLSNLARGQSIYCKHLGSEISLYGQFSSAYSPLLPEALLKSGYYGALHAAFDGGSFPVSEQRKIRWGRDHDSSLDALSAAPLNTALPETWLALAERIGDTIGRHHVATVLLAGWPGQEHDAYDALRRISRFGSVLGKRVTLKEYFELTTAAETWSTFFPAEYGGNRQPTAGSISSNVTTHRQYIREVHQQLISGIEQVIPFDALETAGSVGSLTLNPWTFDAPKYGGINLLRYELPTERPWHIDAVPAGGYVWRANEPALSQPTPPVVGRQLRNEHLDLVVSDESGGIQSLRTLHDRRTRVSQRLVFCDPSIRRAFEAEANATEPVPPPAMPQMVADIVETTRNDAVVDEITSRGRIVDAGGTLLARFTQSVRLPRALPAAIVDVRLQIEQPARGDGWSNYFASRVAWRDDAATIRRGRNWCGKETDRERIESAEWIEIDEHNGKATIFPLGLPFHRRLGPTMLDTLLAVDSQTEVRQQFAIGLDLSYPVHWALALVTADAATATKPSGTPGSPRGWFLHTGAKSVLATHLEPLAAPRSGLRLRLLETEGRSVRASVAAFRPFVSGRLTDFRGGYIDSVREENGALPINFGPHQWLQLEAEW